jgi:hypothetical protein
MIVLSHFPHVVGALRATIVSPLPRRALALTLTIRRDPMPALSFSPAIKFSIVAIVSTLPSTLASGDP